jgi:hypothetical protein
LYLILQDFLEVSQNENEDSKTSEISKWELATTQSPAGHMSDTPGADTLPKSTEL